MRSSPHADGPYRQLGRRCRGVPHLSVRRARLHGYARFNRVAEPILGQGRSAYNTYLSVAVGAGVIGLALLLALVVVVTIGVVASPERRLEFLVIVAIGVAAMVPANLENNKSV